jgi:hypothetical protein
MPFPGEQLGFRYRERSVAIQRVVRVGAVGWPRFARHDELIDRKPYYTVSG